MLTLPYLCKARSLFLIMFCVCIVCRSSRALLWSFVVQTPHFQGNTLKVYIPAKSLSRLLCTHQRAAFSMTRHPISVKPNLSLRCGILHLHFFPSDWNLTSARSPMKATTPSPNTTTTITRPADRRGYKWVSSSGPRGKGGFRNGTPLHCIY